MTTGVLSRTFSTHIDINMMQIASLCCLQPEHHHHPTIEQGPVIEMPHFSLRFSRLLTFYIDVAVEAHFVHLITPCGSVQVSEPPLLTVTPDTGRYSFARIPEGPELASA
jgi:hypothetical protein